VGIAKRFADLNSVVVRVSQKMDVKVAGTGKLSVESSLCGENVLEDSQSISDTQHHVEEYVTSVAGVRICS
jgi:hypothetical protein